MRDARFGVDARGFVGGSDFGTGFVVGARGLVGEWELGVGAGGSVGELGASGSAGESGFLVDVARFVGDCGLVGESGFVVDEDGVVREWNSR